MMRKFHTGPGTNVGIMRNPISGYQEVEE